ncbi:mechanosensitive ion channel domain-containing protein [Thiolapillus brandeum]|nr:mechanosensitive ion channel domain-containing protein [Thiolapillus brandeum]
MPLNFMRFIQYLLLAAMATMVSAKTISNSPLTVSREQLDTAMADVESSSDLTDEKRKKILAIYKEAQDWLARYNKYRDKAQEYLASRTEAPRQSDALQEQLKAQKEKVLDVSGFKKKSLQELEQLLETEKAAYTAKETRVETLSQAVADETGRPDMARRELADITRQLDELKQGFPKEAKPNAEAQAQWWRDKATMQALKAKADMLEQEILSQPARLKLLHAKLDLARAEADGLFRKIDALKDFINQQRKKEAEQVSRSEDAAELKVAQEYPALKSLARDNAILAEELKEMTQTLEEASKKDNGLQEKIKQMEAEYLSTKRKVEIAGLREALGQVLLERRKSLPDPRSYKKKEARIRKEITETGLRLIRHKEKLRKLENQPPSLEQLDPGISDQEKKALEKPFQELMERKKALLQRIIATDEAYLRVLSEHGVLLRRALTRLRDYDDFLAGHLLWVRNTPVISLGDLKKIPAELNELMDVQAWIHMWKALARQLIEPVPALLLLLLVIVHVAGRRWLKKALVMAGPRSGKPASGSFTATLKAMLISFLLPVSSILLLVFLTWQLTLVSTDVPEYADALVRALRNITLPLYSLLVMRAMIRPQGLLDQHFHWRRSSVSQLRRAVNWLLVTFVPTNVLIILIVNLAEEGLAGVTLKLMFAAAVLFVSVFIYMVFQPHRGTVAGFLERNSRGFLYRFRWLWFSLLLSVPLGLMLLSFLGYVYTAGTLLHYLINTLWLLAGLILVQQLMEHWLLLSRRRIAYQAALERRQAMKERKEAGEESPESMDGDVPEPKVDLVALSKESRKLLNASMLIAGAVGIWLIWSQVMPALGILDTVPLWQRSVTVDGVVTKVPVTMGDVMLVIAIAVATLVAARNLPSLLEIILLQYFNISAGSRYAARTLSGYVIVAVGLVLVFQAMGGDWAQIQWLVAALSVGIGFGLQEIVANFISGLIILFERPIRVGDYVTVGDTDGTVTRIQIRATTILTRDRKELLVPNKEFITGRLLNWSLSDSTTRLKLVVGIPYGADVKLASKLMAEAAQEHARVQQEPRPFVYFESFGDSALMLELRCVIDNVDYRITTLSELHHAIDAKFREAGMEIPFPQQDVHLDVRMPLEVKLQPE